MTNRVWIAQCLCPSRHCIMAGAAVADTYADAEECVAEPLRTQIDTLLGSGRINPWCGICHARNETWRIELGRTAWTTMDEAMPALREEETKNRLAAILIGDGDTGSGSGLR